MKEKELPTGTGKTAASARPGHDLALDFHGARYQAKDVARSAAFYVIQSVRQSALSHVGLRAISTPVCSWPSSPCSFAAWRQGPLPTSRMRYCPRAVSTYFGGLIGSRSQKALPA